MDSEEFTRVYISKEVRARVHKLKGPEKTYNEFIQDLCEEHENRPQPVSDETGQITSPTKEGVINV